MSQLLQTAGSGGAVLEADGIQLAFSGRKILSNIYLRAQVGQITGLLGRNGSGKSTLLQTTFGSRTVPDASVRVSGRRAVPAFCTPALLNYLPQAQLLPPNLSIHQAARWPGVNLSEATAAFPELQAQLNYHPGELSGGTLRLVQVLTLLHANTAFSLFDEPFTGVMPVHIETLGEEMRRACQRKGIVLTDHRYAEVLLLCDVVYLLHQGRLLKLGANPREELRDYGYLAS